MHYARSASFTWMVACSLSMAAGSAIAAAFPAGKYGAGGMSIEFGANGRFHVTEGGQSIVEGTYKADGDKLTLTDVSGPQACAGKAASGTYYWRLDHSALTLTKADDPCEDRASDLSGHTMQKQ
jgi:hypothetical protein